MHIYTHSYQFPTTHVLKLQKVVDKQPVSWSENLFKFKLTG